MFGLLGAGFAIFAGFVIFLAFTSHDASRSGAEAEAVAVAEQFETLAEPVSASAQCAI